MNEVSDVLGRMVSLLNQAQIPHMVAGSFASTFYGKPRTTQDIDLVIDPTAPSLAAFVVSLPPKDYYVSGEAAQDALQRRTQFNVIDMATGWKIDLIVRKGRRYSVEEFRRRTPVRMFEIDVFVATPEDVILSKLEWASMSGSERQLRDVRGILDVRQDAVDLAYIERWAAELSVLDLWQQVSSRP